jgi:hypothetical protein
MRTVQVIIYFILKLTLETNTIFSCKTKKVNGSPTCQIGTETADTGRAATTENRFLVLILWFSHVIVAKQMIFFTYLCSFTYMNISFTSRHITTCKLTFQ